MKLINLIEHIEAKKSTPSQNCDVTGLAYNSADVKPGYCFVAIRGTNADGHKYIDDAIERGAVAIVSEKEVVVPDGVNNIVVGDTRDALARLSAKFFDDPSLGFRLVGITGTNGKTTTTYILESIWKAAGLKVGVIGTVNYRYGHVEQIPLHTTPQSFDLQCLFRSMSDAGVGAVAMEVSSHALDQQRVVGCQFDGAIFTNLTQDHLDYHGDMKTYGAAKRRLFTERLTSSLKKKVWAAVNWDDPFSRELIEGASYPVYRYSVKDKVEVYAKSCESSLKGSRIVIATPAGEFEVMSNLKGLFNVANILSAVAAAVAMEIPLETIKAGVESMRVVPGRLEPVENAKAVPIFVDYAHTPDALKNVLNTLRPITPKRLITVFGCGGDRDAAKRPLMGEVVGRMSDVAIVTSDNPRREIPASIISQVVPGVVRTEMSPYNNEKGYLVIEDRKEAIREALKMQREGDVVLIAGKGHEDYQIIGTKKFPFDDRKIAQEIVNGI